MFGHTDNNQQQDDPIATAQDDIAASAEAFANDGNTTASDPLASGTLGSFMNTPAPDAVAPTALPVAADDLDITPVPAVLAVPAVPDATVAPVTVAAPGTDDLLDIKHEALQALTPLVSQLNQTPEEQFRTTMMMIQASDNRDLIKVAYEAAQKISNEKERAQALLDIVNEINYFTQQA